MTDELKQWEYDRGYDKGKADGARDFAEWCKMKGYGCYDWGMLFAQYEKEKLSEVEK